MFGFKQEKFSKDRKKIKQTYKNTWITSLKLTSKNIVKLAIARRSRSKIENETFNALKNNGYHLEHSYGHGKRRLAFNMIERLFMMAVDYSGTKKMFFGSLKFGIQQILWPDWRYFLEYLAGKNDPIKPI